MSLISDVKEVAEVVKKMGQVELSLKMVGLQGQIVDLQTENLELKQKVKELEERFEVAKQMRRVGHLYYGEKDIDPYCPHCWEMNHVAIHLLPHMGKSSYLCSNCKNHIPNPDYKSPNFKSQPPKRFV
jgi:hypothetical protein